MSRLGRRACAACAAVAALGVAAGAPAQQPTSQRIDVNETFADEFLTEACGVPVTTTLEGFVIVREFSGERQRLRELTTINLTGTATSGDNVVRFRDVGSDQVRVGPDGAAVVSIAGQAPFAFRGVMKINLDTGEVVHEPQRSGDRQLQAVCAELAS